MYPQFARYEFEREPKVFIFAVTKQPVNPEKIKSSADPTVWNCIEKTG